jgi:hypothetical protein
MGRNPSQESNSIGYVQARADTAEPPLVVAASAYRQSPPGEQHKSLKRQGDALPRQQPPNEQSVHALLPTLDIGLLGGRFVQDSVREYVSLPPMPRGEPRDSLTILDEDELRVAPGQPCEGVQVPTDGASQDPTELE